MARRVLLYLAVAAGIVLFAALFIFIFANSLQISCRQAGDGEATCSITKAFLGRWPISHHDVMGITGVEMDESCDDGCSYRAVLVTSQGNRVPFNEVYTDAYVVRPQLEAVQAFLNGSPPTLEYTEPVPWWVVIMISSMAVIGLGVVVVNFLKRVGAPSGTPGNKKEIIAAGDDLLLYSSTGGAVGP